MNWSLLLVIIVSCSTEIFRCAATVNHGVNKRLPLTGRTFEEITVIASNDVVDEEATLTASNNEIGESDEYPGSLDAEKLALYRQLDSSKSIDELFQWVDEIPAIRNCYDRAMRISMASKEDSFLAVTGLYRLANILINLQTDKPHLHRHQLYLDEQHLTIDKIRRIEQLCECIDLHLSSLPIEDVAKSLWSIVTIDSSEEYMQKIMLEYQDRIKAHKNLLKFLEYEDVALMIWTIGCVKDRYAMNSEALIDQLIDVFVAKVNYTLSSQQVNQSSASPSSFQYQSSFVTTGGMGSTIAHPTINLFHDDILKVVNSKLIIRMLWSLALHKSSHPYQLSMIVQGLKASIASLSELSITNKVSLLWCCAQFMIDDKTILLPLLRDLDAYIRKQQYTPTSKGNEKLTVYEIKYITDALCTISQAARKSYIRFLEKNESMGSTGGGPITNPATATATATLSFPASSSMIYSAITGSDLLEVLNEINVIVKQLIRYALQSPDFFANPSLSGIIGLFQAITSIEIIPGEDQGMITEFLSQCLQRFQKEVDAKISAKDAASILEAMVTMPDYPDLLVTELERHRLQDASYTSMNTIDSRTEAALFPSPKASSVSTSSNNKENTKSHSNNDQKKSKKEIIIPPTEMIYTNPIWHEFAGKLSVICSLSAGDIGDKAKMIAATWAVACLGHSYRPLYRVARRATQFTLHETSPRCLARLAVSIAKEEAASFATGGGMSVKLDHEFVDQVAINTLRRAKEVDSLKELIHAITCIAFLGRLSSSGTKLQWAATHGATPTSSITTPPTAPIPPISTTDLSVSMVDVPTVATRYLSTKQIIRLQWAIGRLPVGIFTPSTSQALKQELEHRILFTKFPDLMTTKEKIAIQDTFLYVKTLTDSVALKDHRLDFLKDKICQALMSHCEVLVSKTASQSLINYSLGKFSTYEKENFVMKLSILIDSLQAFIELGWYHPEMLHLCRQYLLLISSYQQQEHISNVHTKSSVQFKKGILEELLKMYQQLPYHKGIGKHPNTLGSGSGSSNSNTGGTAPNKKEKSRSLFARFFSQ